MFSDARREGTVAGRGRVYNVYIFPQLGRAKLVGKKHKYFLTSRRRLRRRGRKNTYARPAYNRGISRTPQLRQIG